MAVKQQMIRTRTDRGVLVTTIIEAKLQGEEQSFQLQEELKKAVQDSDTYRVVVDMQHVISATSRPLGALAGFSRHLVKDQGGKVALCNLSPAVRAAMGALHFIEAGKTGSLVRPADQEQTSENKPFVLFEIVTDDEIQAVDALAQ